MLEAVLRVPATYDEQETKEELSDAVLKIFRKYGGDIMLDVSRTANVVLRGTKDGKFSIFYGLDFSDRDIDLGLPVVVTSIRDIQKIPTEVPINEFESIFFRNFSDTDVVIDSIANKVFIFRGLLSRTKTRQSLV